MMLQVAKVLLVVKRLYIASFACSALKYLSFCVNRSIYWVVPFHFRCLSHLDTGPLLTEIEQFSTSIELEFEQSFVLGSLSQTQRWSILKFYFRETAIDPKLSWSDLEMESTFQDRKEI